MPLPFLAVPMLISLATVATVGFGVKKGLDAKRDYDDAKDTNQMAKHIYKRAEIRLDSKRKSTQSALESLGKLKYSVIKDSIIPFIDAFSQIKNIKQTINLDGREISLPSNEKIYEMKLYASELKEVFSGGLASVGAGGLVGLAAYGSVGTFATASTGTAIAGLSGVAATNATLAWFGGGSLASGGLGMAGGMAVLGGIVAGPVLALGGIILASKAKAEKENAYANLSYAELAVEEMETAFTIVSGISASIYELEKILKVLIFSFSNHLKFIKNKIRYENDYKKFSDYEIKKVYEAYTVYETLSNLINVKLLNQNGTLTNEIERNIAMLK